MIWNIHESRGNGFLKNPSNILQEVLLSKCKTNIKVLPISSQKEKYSNTHANGPERGKSLL